MFLLSLERWELLHTVRLVRLVCLTPWASCEPRRGLGNCTLIQQINRPNPTQQIVCFFFRQRIITLRVQLWPGTQPSPGVNYLQFPVRDMCPFFVLKTKIRKVFFKRLSSQMSSLPKISHEILCHQENIIVRFWNSNWALK